MTIENIREMLGWSALFNLALLCWWLFILSTAHDWLYRLHTRWFTLTLERFDAVHYLSMGLYKILIIVFIVVPYFSLRVMA